MTSNSATNVPLLTTANYSLWELAMQDYLRARGHWFWIHNPVPPETDSKTRLKCLVCRDEAVGEIRRHLSAELRSIATASDDPQTILNAIKDEYGKSSFATRHNALQGLLNVRQDSSEPIPAFIAHAREALRFLQSTRPPPTPLPSPLPSTPTYSLQDADKELLIAVLLNGTKYTALTTSLLAELSIQQVEDALKNEEAHRLGVSAAAAAAATSPSSNLAAPASSSICAFCGRNGHAVEQCFKFRDASRTAKEQVQQQEASGGSKKRFKKKGKANAAQEGSTSTTPVESAGAASIRLSSSPSSLPDAWNADTGATSHMTPRREWFKSYNPCSVPIRVANGQVVYAAGRGTVEFAPVKDSHKLRPVLFSNVLHVPALNQNLLSVLTLTCDHAFDVRIHFCTIEFIKDSIP